MQKLQIAINLIGNQRRQKYRGHDGPLTKHQILEPEGQRFESFTLPLKYPGMPGLSSDSTAEFLMEM